MFRIKQGGDVVTDRDIISAGEAEEGQGGWGSFPAQPSAARLLTDPQDTSARCS